jgi:hypothetical protein
MTVLTPEEVVGELRDGMTIGIGGWGSRRKPMALVRAILRSPLKDLVIVSYAGPDVGLLVASGQARRVVTGFASLDSIALEPHFRRARQEGTVELTEVDEGMLHWGLLAAAHRLPFLPIRAGLGSGVLEVGRMDLGQGAAAAADRGAHGVDDVGLGHRRLPVLSSSARTRSSLAENRMHIAYTPEQERLRRELCGYFGELMTPEIRAALSGEDEDYGDGGAYREVVRRLGRDGWLALGWPQEYGGRGGTMLDQLIFTDEAAVARVPGAVPDHQHRGADHHAVRHPGAASLGRPGRGRGAGRGIACGVGQGRARAAGAVLGAGGDGARGI